MSIPHQAGFSPDRWKQVVNVMLKKSPGNSKIHRLRIITFQDSDFNQGNQLNLGRPLVHDLEDTQLLPAMQHGARSSKLCVSAVLNKVISMEIHRYMKKPCTYLENYAPAAMIR
jgi:hypothetical protein